MVRIGKEIDIDNIVNILFTFHAESGFNDISIDTDFLKGKIIRYISHKDVIVLVDHFEEDINGVLIAYVSEFFFSKCIGAWDIAFYFRPGCRGGTAPFRMINEYIRWAKMRNAQRIFLGTAAADDPGRVGKFYQSCGFENAGEIFRYIGKNK